MYFYKTNSSVVDHMYFIMVLKKKSLFLTNYTHELLNLPQHIWRKKQMHWHLNTAEESYTDAEGEQ